MWDLGDATPPASPTVRVYQGRSNLSRSDTRRDRSSGYYKNITKRRAVEHEDAVEEAFGWSGNAAGVAGSQQPRQSESSDYFGQGVSLQALIDPKDVERKPKSPSIGHAVPRRRPLRFQSILRRLFRLSSRQAGAGGFSRRPSTYHDPAEERERHRRSRDEFLERRKQRGSIMYSKDTGLAQIPLYAAPSTAEVASAPALSSFAPRAPLQPRNVNKAPPDPSAGWNIAVAKASATVDRDGNILEVKKEKAYKRGNARYSAFVQGQQKQGLVIPTEPLPTSRSSSPAAAMHAS